MNYFPDAVGYLCQGGTYGTGPGYGWHGWQMMGFPFGGLIMMLVMVAVVFLAIRMFSPARGIPRERPQAPKESPLEILKRRYASGEIDKETFESMKSDLSD